MLGIQNQEQRAGQIDYGKIYNFGSPFSNNPDYPVTP
jgi:hypothetical protein